MDERNDICFFTVKADIKDNEIYHKININENIYPNIKIDNKELNTIINRCIENTIIIMKSMSNLDMEINFKDEELFIFRLSETDENIVVRLLINEKISKFFLDSKVLELALTLNDVKYDLALLGDTLIKSINNKTDKNIVSDIVIFDLSNPVDLFDIKIGLNKDNKVFSIFNVNKFMYEKPLTDKYIEERLKNSEILLALEDVFKGIKDIIYKYKKFFPKDDIGMIMSSTYLKSDNKFNLNIAYKNDNIDFTSEIDDFINKKETRDAISFINYEILNF